MFTGIIEEVGTLLSSEPASLVIQARTVLQDVEIKDSVAVDGTCLTVIERGEDWFRVDTMPETLRRTRLGALGVGAPLNLERSLAANGRMGGHMVQGHIEGTSTILALTPDGIGLDMEISLTAQLAPYIIAKGFVAINGVSLTVVDRQPDRFSVSLIPYTREHTNLGQLQVGAQLNIESDIIGRYVVQLLKQSDVLAS
ncbi:MAG: riboflavin synthase [Ktedonobacteraceae bacterium]